MIDFIFSIVLPLVYGCFVVRVFYCVFFKKEDEKNEKFFVNKIINYIRNNRYDVPPDKKENKENDSHWRKLPSLEERSRYNAIRKDKYGNLYGIDGSIIDKAAIEIKKQTEFLKKQARYSNKNKRG